jgi:Fe2+ transport system protein FeoA
VDTIKVVIKRNAPYENGMFGMSVHNEPGGAANVSPINSEQDLRVRLLAFGLTPGYATDVVDRLKQRHDSVTIDVDKSKLARR